MEGEFTQAVSTAEDKKGNDKNEYERS